MVMSSAALLKENPDPSDEAIKEALAGNLCRCTGYTGIMRGVRCCGNYREGGGCVKKDETPTRTKHETVGISIPRIDAADKVTGRAIYTADVHLHNMAHGKLLGSTVAHGIIRKLDVSRARALPGVLAILTGNDVTDTLHGVSPARYDEPVLCKDKVRHVGDPVAVVRADSR